MGNNLLPPAQKEELKNEQKNKKIILILALFLSAEIILTGVILFLYYYANSEVIVVNEKILLNEQKLKEPLLQEIKNQIDGANQNLYKISAIKREQVSVVEFLEKLVLASPQESFLKSLSFQNVAQDIENPETKTVSRVFFGKSRINGIAQDRETLLSFKKSLDQEVAFSDVYFDPISWVKPKDPEFWVEFSFFPNYDSIKTKN